MVVEMDQVVLLNQSVPMTVVQGYAQATILLHATGTTLHRRAQAAITRGRARACTVLLAQEQYLVLVIRHQGLVRLRRAVDGPQH